MSADNTTRKGKIARLPRTIREELNGRLSDGQPGSVVLPWLNDLPEVKAILEQHFSGEPISDQNLTGWRQGGYLDWCADEARADLIEAKSEMALKIVAKSGLRLNDAAAAIVAGDILAEIEASEPGEARESLVKQIVALRNGDHSYHDGVRMTEKLALDREKASLKKREVILAENKFRRMLVEKLIETAQKPEVQKILGSGKSKAVQMDLLHKELFGEDEEESA